MGEAKTLLDDTINRLTTRLNLERRLKRKQLSKQLAENNLQNRTFECEHCKKNFTANYTLRRHIHSVHDEDPAVFECNLCGRHFGRKDSLNDHIKNIHSKTKYPCSKCGKIFYNRSSRSFHCQRFCLGEQPLPGYTGDESTTVEDVDTHENKLQTVGFECKDCKKVFASIHTLRRHTRTVHDDSASVECNECGRRYSRKDSLQLHIQMKHLNRKPAPIPGCTSGESEAMDVDMDPHEIEMQTVPFKCIQCHKVFTLNENLRRHINTVHEDSTVLCDKCGSRFRRGDSFREHIRAKHSLRKPKYPCSKCGKSFSRADYRNRHCRTCCPSAREQPLQGYTGDESHAVDVEEYIQVGAQTQPAVDEPGPSTVTSEKPTILDNGCVVYTCPKCRSEYIRKQNWRRHLMLGCDVTPPLSCSYCDYKTHYKTALKRHIFQHHKSEKSQWTL